MRSSTWFILITVTLDAMGIGLILPVMPELISSVRGAGLADAALWGGVLSASYAVMQFTFAPTLGQSVRPRGAPSGPADLHGGASAGLCGDGAGGHDLVAVFRAYRRRDGGGHPRHRAGLYGRYQRTRQNVRRTLA